MEGYLGDSHAADCGRDDACVVIDAQPWLQWNPLGDMVVRQLPTYVIEPFAEAEEPVVLQVRRDEKGDQRSRRS